MIRDYFQLSDLTAKEIRQIRKRVSHRDLLKHAVIRYTLGFNLFNVYQAGAPLTYYILTGIGDCNIFSFNYGHLSTLIGLKTQSGSVIGHTFLYSNRNRFAIETTANFAPMPSDFYRRGKKYISAPMYMSLATIYNDIAAENYEKKKYRKAFQLSNVAVKINPKEITARSSNMISHYQLGMKKKAFQLSISLAKHYWESKNLIDLIKIAMVMQCCPKTFETQYYTGLAQSLDGSPRKAIFLLRKALKYTKANHQRRLTYNAIASNFIKLKKFDQAKKALQQIKRKDPHALAMLGLIAIFNGKTKLGWRHLTRAKKMGPQNSEVLNLVAFSYYIFDNYKKAELNYKLAIKTNPRDPTSHIALGALYNVMQKKGLRKSDVTPIIHAGRIFHSNKNYMKALGAFKIAASINPKNARVLWHLSGTLFKLKKYKKALKTIRKALKTARGGLLTQCLITQSSLLFKMGKTEESFELTIKAGNRFIKSGKYHDAINIFLNILAYKEKFTNKKHPLLLKDCHGHALVGIGIVYAKIGYLKAALHFMKRAQRKWPMNPIAYFNIAVLYERFKRVSKRKTTRYDDKIVSNYSQAGDYFMEKKRYAKAELAYRNALKIDRKHLLTITGLGNLFLARGEKDKAIICFKKALVISPGFGPALEGLKKAPKKGCERATSSQ